MARLTPNSTGHGGHRIAASSTPWEGICDRRGKEIRDLRLQKTEDIIEAVEKGLLAVE